MAKRQSSLSLPNKLQADRADQRRKLAEELGNLRDFRAATSPCDSGDVAFETSSDEMASQLAEGDSRELGQIERAEARLKQGEYGNCEGISADCQRTIPLARLKAQPHTTLCINCERARERQAASHGQHGMGDWGQVLAWELLMEEKHMELSELDRDLCGKEYAPIAPWQFENSVGFFGTKKGYAS